MKDRCGKGEEIKVKCNNEENIIYLKKKRANELWYGMGGWKMCIRDTPKPAGGGELTAKLSRPFKDSPKILHMGAVEPSTMFFIHI